MCSQRARASSSRRRFWKYSREEIRYSKLVLMECALWWLIVWIPKIFCRLKWNKYPIWADLIFQHTTEEYYFFIITLSCHLNTTYSHCSMGQNPSKPWFWVGVGTILTPLVCISAPIAVLAGLVFGCMVNFCCFGMCWGRKTHDYLYYKMTGTEFGRYAR